jgi:plastocyanin
MSIQKRLLMLAPCTVILATLLVTRSDGRLVADTEVSAAPQVSASIRNGAFEPARIQIARGATVVWKNDDAVAHTVTGTSGGWGSTLIEPGGTYRHEFDRPGSFGFYCVPHPNMKGTVVVK